LIEPLRVRAALKADGSIKAWTDSGSGRKRAPAGKGYTGIYSNPYAFAALKADGSIKAWGNPKFGGRPHTLIEPLRVRAAKALSVE
jgi:hypothetical protein